MAIAGWLLLLPLIPYLANCSLCFDWTPQRFSPLPGIPAPFLVVAGVESTLLDWLSSHYTASTHWGHNLLLSQLLLCHSYLVQPPPPSRFPTSSPFPHSSEPSIILGSSIYFRRLLLIVSSLHSHSLNVTSSAAHTKLILVISLANPQKVLRIEAISNLLNNTSNTRPLYQNEVLRCCFPGCGGSRQPHAPGRHLGHRPLRFRSSWMSGIGSR